MNRQNTPETDTDTAEAEVEAMMDHAATRLRSQMAQTMAALQPHLTALATLAGTGTVPSSTAPPSTPDDDNVAPGT